MIPYTKLRPTTARRSPEELLTLAHPLALFIESTNVCNFKCGICTQSQPDFGQRAGYYKHMPSATFDKLFRQVFHWQKPIKVVRFYGIGEPLLNRDLPNMICTMGALAERTEISTNGVLLGQHAYPLIQSGLDYVRVSVYQTDDYEYQRETGSKVTASEVLASVRKFRLIRDQAGSKTPRICAKLTTANPDWKAFERQYSGVADDLEMELPYNWGSTSDRLVQLAPDRPTPRRVCPKPFFELMIKANGDVAACCVDWAGQLVVGNVATDTLQEIWEGDKLRAIRQAHLNGQRGSIAACANCNLPDVTPDNMDGLIGTVLHGR